MIPTLTNPLGLPPYRRLNYLASTGAQYIDTGVKPDYAGGDTVELKFYMADPGNAVAYPFGNSTTSVRNGFYLSVEGRSMYNVQMRLVAADATSFQQVDMFSVDTKHWNEDVTVKVSDGSIEVSSTYLNGTSTFTKHVTSQYSVYLFTFNREDNPYTIYSGMRLYDWKYYRNGTLAQHLVPVLDLSGVPCLFDTVTRTLKYNAGTGAFNYA